MRASLHSVWRRLSCRCCGQLLYRENLTALVDNVLDPVRERLGKAITVNSGYRCPKHNKAVGGVANSQHMTGEAADIVCADLPRLKALIIENGNYDQLIDYGTFLHVSYKRGGMNRWQKLWHR